VWPYSSSLSSVLYYQHKHDQRIEYRHVDPELTHKCGFAWWAVAVRWARFALRFALNTYLINEIFENEQYVYGDPCDFSNPLFHKSRVRKGIEKLKD
jgi:hypothetical protein